MRARVNGSQYPAAGSVNLIGGVGCAVSAVKDDANDELDVTFAISSGTELAYAELVATQLQTNNVAVTITGCEITFTVVDRPVHIFGYAGVAAHATAGQNVQLYLTDAANTILTRDIHTSGVANAMGHIEVHARIATPGTYTRRLRFIGSSVTANSASVMLGNLGDAYIVALQS